MNVGIDLIGVMLENSKNVCKYIHKKIKNIIVFTKL